MITFINSSMALGVLVFLLSFSIASGETNTNKEVTIKGRVIDPVCLLTMNMKGEGHKGCALNCAKAGEILAIMDEKGTVAVGGSEIKGKGTIKVSFSTDPDPPKSGDTAFKFKLTDSEGRPITDAKVKFTIIMPAMSGMAEMRSAGDTRYVGDGTYVGELNIPVGGSWTLAVEALVPGKPPVNESFDINVR